MIGLPLFVVLLALTVGGTVLFAASAHGPASRRRILLVGLLLVLCGTGAFSIHAFRLYRARVTAPSIAHTLGSRVDQNGVVRQTSGVSCGPAAAANLLRLYGIEKSENELAALMGTTARGTLVSRMSAGLGTLGFACAEKRIGLAGLPALQNRAILVVDHPLTGRESHVVVYCGRTNQTSIVRDPLRGELLLSDRELRAVWHGRLIECRFRESQQDPNDAGQAGH